MPFFNRLNNDDLILAIQAAGVTRGRTGFHKNKAGEKLAESEEDLLEHRTDGTDAFDTLFIGCEKFLLINQAFQGKQRLMPFFNRQNNDDLILAVQAAGVTRGRNGFHKDKGGEKLAETEEDLLEHRTDGTDAFDTLFIGCEKFPQSDYSVGMVDMGGVM